MFIIYIFAAAAALAAAVGWWALDYTCIRHKEPDWENQSALELSAWAEFAESIPVAAQWVRKHHGQTVSTTSFDGLTLKAVWVPVENSKATVILFHGYRCHFLNDFAAIFSLYHAMGLNLLLVHQRAQGPSEGKYITYGVRERRDVATWVDFHNRTHGMDNVFIGGLSMGASTVLYAAGDDLPDNVRGVTADCGFTSPYEIISIVAQRTFPWMPVKVVAWLLNCFTRVFAGFGLKDCDTRETLARTRLPVLLIHGTADTFVPCWMSEESYKYCAQERTLLLVEGADHGWSFLKDPDRLIREVAAFFNRHLSDQYSGGSQ